MNEAAALFASRALPIVTALDWPKARIEIEVSSEIEVALRGRCCAKEPETCEWLNRVCRPGVVLWDVGACVGAYALIAASLGATVVAVEPQSRNFARLAGNLERNRGWRIFKLPVALTDTESATPLRDLGGFAGASAALALSGFPIEVVLGMPLDDLVARWRFPAPTALKIDVDGGELGVLRGAARSLPTVEHVMVEATMESAGEVWQLLAEAGLRQVARHPRIAEGVFNWEWAR